MAVTPAVFLDKDGTLLEDVPYNVDPQQMRYAPGARDALRRLGRLGWPLVVVSNQPGVGLGRFPETALSAVSARLAEMFADCGAQLTAFCYCPHAPGAGCDCRKPGAALLTQAAAAHGLDLSRSWMVGDILDDIEAGHRAGCRAILIDNGNETLWQRGPLREPEHRVADLDAAARLIAADARRGLAALRTEPA